MVQADIDLEEVCCVEAGWGVVLMDGLECNDYNSMHDIYIYIYVCMYVWVGRWVLV
jgi:hypothetical protein